VLAGMFFESDPRAPSTRASVGVHAPTTRRRARPACAWLLVACLWSTLAAAPLDAQDAQQRQAAAAAFDRGSTAYLQEDFATAARWFEMANDLAPAAGALAQAIRAHQRAGNTLRAATLSLRLIARFPDDQRAVSGAQTVLDEESGNFFRVDVECDAECAVEADGTLMSHNSFFLEPGVDHVVGATFDTGTEEETVQGEPGDVRALQFEAPEGSARLEAPDVGSERESGTERNPLEAPPRGETEEPSGGGGLSPAIFITSLVLTVGAGATLIWSGLDTLSAADEYEQTANAWMGSGDPATLATAQRMLSDGESKELRTNILIGATAGLAALTVLFAALTDWGGGGDDDGDAASLRVAPRLSLGAKDRQGGMVLEGTF
jgi:hypothetical protein